MSDEAAPERHADALVRAAAEGAWEQVESICEAGAAVDALGDDAGVPRCALHAAVLRGHVEVVDALLKRGADPNVADGRGVTALHSVFGPAERFHETLLGLLLEGGADVNAITDATQHDEGGSPLLELVRGAVRHEYGGFQEEEALLDAAQALLERGADPNARSHGTGDTALHWVAEADHMALAEILLAHGADPNQENEHGDLPVDVAQSDELEIALREHGMGGAFER